MCWASAIELLELGSIIVLRTQRVSSFVSKQCMNSFFRFLAISIVFSILVSGFSAAHAKQVLVFGDSLSAAYGMDIEKGWVHLLDESLSLNMGTDYQVFNASISGETTRGGLARINLSLEEFQPDIVLLELGANDGLQGYPVKMISANLSSMIDQIQDYGAQVVLLGISIPPSYGPRYVDQFRQLFPVIAQQRELPFIDLYQEEFYLKPGYMQRDGLHPTEITQPIIRDMLIEFLNNQNLL